MNEIARFALFVEYTQILVHLAGHPKPGLLWNDDHVAQGFAWSEGLVSFGIPDHDGQVVVSVQLDDNNTIKDEAIWAVQVPFDVTEPLRIGTVFETTVMDIPLGTYDLILEALNGFDDYVYQINLRFVPSAAAGFGILKRGAEIQTDEVLTTTAELAG